MRRAVFFRALIGVAFAGLLASCASDPIPDVAYYRLPPGDPPTARAEPAFREPIVVDVLIAYGVYSGQAILYQTKPEAPVKEYHYQLWQNPPVRLVQQRLIRRLRKANVSAVVADRLPNSILATRVSGVIENFERVRVSETEWKVVVQVELRADRGNDDLPLVLETYTAELPTDNDSIQGTVRAFTQAVNQVIDEFANDLAAAGEGVRPSAPAPVGEPTTDGESPEGSQP
jgi:cholesterol transport system auxiliary component